MRGSQGSSIRTRGTGDKELRERRNASGLDRTTFSEQAPF